MKPRMSTPPPLVSAEHALTAARLILGNALVSEMGRYKPTTFDALHRRMIAFHFTAISRGESS